MGAGPLRKTMFRTCFEIAVFLADISKHKFKIAICGTRHIATLQRVNTSFLLTTFALLTHFRPPGGFENIATYETPGFKLNVRPILQRIPALLGAISTVRH